MSKRKSNKKNDMNNEILSKMYSIFNPSIYEIFISNNTGDINLIINDKTDNMCGNLIYYNNTNELFVNKIEKCNLSGTQFLNNLDELANILQLEEIILEDKSNIIIKCKKLKYKINLALLNILSTGISWYNSKGYISANYVNEIEHNSNIINLSMEELLKIINYKPYNDILENELVKDYFTRKKQELIYNQQNEIEQDCNFIKWLYSFFNDSKLKQNILYNVYLSKNFSQEVNISTKLSGGINKKNKKTKTTNHKKYKKNKTTNYKKYKKNKTANYKNFNLF
jgi:hypothetical protein